MQFNHWSDVVPLALNGLDPYENDIGQNKQIMLNVCCFYFRLELTSSLLDTLTMMWIRRSAKFRFV